MPYDRSAFITRTPLENVAYDYMFDSTKLLADKLFTPKPVTKADTKVAQYDLSKLRRYSTAKGTNAEANKIDEQLFYSNVSLVEYKLGSDVNPRDVRDADFPQLLDDARKVKLCTQGLLLDRELIAANLATTSTNYPSAQYSAIASGSRWNEAGGDPEADMITANIAIRNSTGRAANAIAMDVTTRDKLKLSPAFRSRTQYTMPGPVTDDIIKAFFGVDYLFVGEARYDSSFEGVAASIGSIWGANVVAFVYDPNSSMESQSYGSMYLTKAPFWTEINVDKKRNGPAGSMRTVEVGTEYLLQAGMVVSSTDADFAGGYLWATAVA